MAFPGHVGLRFMSESSGMIAMQKWPSVCSIEIAATGSGIGTQPFLTAVTRRAVSMGATLHWGQRNDLPMKEIERSFGIKPGESLYRWRQTLAIHTPWASNHIQQSMVPQAGTRGRSTVVVQFHYLHDGGLRR